MQLVVFIAAALACAHAGNIGFAAPVAHYSPATAVSSSYISQASPALAVAHAAPIAASYAAPIAASYAAPIATSYAAPIATSYAAAPVAVHAPAIGQSQQSVVRSLGGAQAISHYSKAVDSAFSSVRKYDTRITNDALSYAHAPVVSAYNAPALTVAHAAPVLSSYTAHAPVVSSYTAHAPAVVSSYAAPAPVLSTYAAHAPVVTKAAVAYSPAAVVSHASFSGLGASYAW